jgi:serine protease Do
VVVRAGNGHGTGAIIDSAGWVITNHHVIADAERDPATGAQTARIYFGQLEGGFMRLIDDGIPALVYKTSPEKDLALLKLTRLPAGKKELPALELAKDVPRPGGDCIAIGHPSAGVLWTVRSGEVSGVGNWPKEMTDIATSALAASAKDKERIAEFLARGPQRKVLVSTVGVNHGDSGGPLVDTQGKLVAVTFAMPPAENRGTARFSYHVHLDEVRAFLAERPKAPGVQVPDPWAAGFVASILDLDDDGTAETVVFGLKPGSDVTGFVIDLKQSTDPKFKVADLRDPERRKAFRFQFAYHTRPARAFYATGRDGQIDLILTAHEPGRPVDSVLRRTGETWAFEDPGKNRSLIEPSLFPDKEMRDRFVQIIKRLSKSAP